MNGKKIRSISSKYLHYSIGENLYLFNVLVSESYSEEIEKFPRLMLDVYICKEYSFIEYYGRDELRKSRIFKIHTSKIKELKEIRNGVFDFIQKNCIEEISNEFVTKEIFIFLCKNNLLKYSSNDKFTCIKKEYIEITFENEKMDVYISCTCQHLELKKEIYLRDDWKEYIIQSSKKLDFLSNFIIAKYI